MSKWGVSQFGSFNVDLVGKAWKTVETSIDKAIGISQESEPRNTRSQHQQYHDQHQHREYRGQRDGYGEPPYDGSVRSARPPQGSSAAGATALPVDHAHPGILVTQSTSNTPTSPTTHPTSSSITHSWSKSAREHNVSRDHVDFSGETSSLEELLNGPSPIPTATRAVEGIKITPKHTKEALQSSDNQTTLSPEDTQDTNKASAAAAMHTIQQQPTSPQQNGRSTQQDDSGTQQSTQPASESLVTIHHYPPPPSSPPAAFPSALSFPLSPAASPTIRSLSSSACSSVTSWSPTASPTVTSLSSTPMANDQVLLAPQPHDDHIDGIAHHPDEDNHHPSLSHSDQLQSSKGLADGDQAHSAGVSLHSLSEPHEATSQEQEHGQDPHEHEHKHDHNHEHDHEQLQQDSSSNSVTRSSSSSSLMELGSDTSSELELRSRLVELNGKMAAIAIIEKEKDRQLEEKTKQLAIREKQLESAMERQAALSSELQNLSEEVGKLRPKPSSSSSSSSSSISSSSSSTNDLVESLKEEFSRRLGATEKKLQAVTKERDEMKKGQSSGDQAKGVAKAKDDEINTLRAEGTNLSLKILSLESALKKYRASKKEDDASLASLREKLTQAEALLEKRNDRVKQLEFSEKKYLETITTMKDVSDIASRKVEKKEMELAQAQKQIQDLQSNLEKATRDLQGAKRTTQEAGDKYLEEVEEAKRNIAQEHQTQSNKLSAGFQTRVTQLEATIAELRATLSSVSEQAGKKEDNFDKEILHLRGCLDAAEKRNEEIMQSIPDSTRPLLRQIEALQALLENKSRTADALERDLRARLADEEARCIAALEKDRASSSLLSEMTHRVTLLETQYEDEHNLVSKLRTEVETLKVDEKKYKRMTAELNAKLSAVERQEEQLNTELRQCEERHQRTISAMKELEEALTKSREKEKEIREELNKLHRFGSPVSGPYNMRRSSSSNQDLSIMAGSIGAGATGGMSMGAIGASPSMNMNMSIGMGAGGGGGAGGGATPLVERLQAMLSQRDGEITVLHSQLSSLESARKELQEELAAFTTKNEMLTRTDTDLQAAETSLQELQTKFSTALQLVGEKEEQVMELKMDIQDLKEMYRTQISELIEQNERLSGSGSGRKK